MTFHLLRPRLPKRPRAVCATCRWIEQKPEPSVVEPNCGHPANDYEMDPVSGLRQRKACCFANEGGRCKLWSPKP